MSWKFKFPFIPYYLEIKRIRKISDSVKAERKPAHQVQRDYDKVFCIGFSKTGTTSMEKLLSIFGFRIGNQGVAEILSEDWSVLKRTDRIINYCYTADAFQDAPFHYPGLYRELDKAFPHSKFILTVRDTPEQWFDSLVRYHTQLFSSDKSRPPNEEDRRNALYRYKGYSLQVAVNNWGYPAVPLYDRQYYIQKYLNHIEEVRQYFAGREGDFIEINLSRKEDFARLCSFLNITTPLTDFPWENRTSDEPKKDKKDRSGK